jgi:hypothetical protein
MPSRRSPPLRAPRAPRAPRACTRECSPIRPRPPERDVSSAYEGVTDLARWRTRVVYRDLDGWWGALEERIVGRWPWLEDVANDDDDDEPLTMDMVYIGTKRFFGTDEGGWRPSDQAMSTRPGVSGPIRCGSWRSYAGSTPRSRAVSVSWAVRHAGASGSGSTSAATASASGCRLGVRAATRTSLATCGSTPPGASGARRGRPRRHAVRARRGATCAISIACGTRPSCWTSVSRSTSNRRPTSSSTRISRRSRSFSTRLRGSCGG